MTRTSQALATLILAIGALTYGLSGACGLVQACAPDHGPAIHHHHRSGLPTTSSPTRDPQRQVHCGACTQQPLTFVRAAHTERHIVTVRRAALSQPDITPDRPLVTPLHLNDLMHISLH